MNKQVFEQMSDLEKEAYIAYEKGKALLLIVLGILAILSGSFCLWMAFALSNI